MLKELTEIQINKMPDYVNKYVKLGHDTSPLPPMNEVKGIVNNIYKILNLPKNAKIVIKDSPLDCWNYIQEVTGQKMEFVLPYLTGSFDANIFAFYDFWQNETDVNIFESKKLETLYNYWKKTLKLGLIYPFDDVCIISKKPIEIHVNDNGIHNENGPAIKYADGFEIYGLNGIKMKKEYITTSWNQLDSNMILKEKNAEVRRELVRKIGIERFVEKANADVIDEKAIKINDELTTKYELLMVDIGADSKKPYLKMINPSIGTYHIEGVHPDCNTVDSALEWRNGTTDIPEILT